jgi:NNP family nitrate/nitrite transporter-like MFS transporter
MNLVLLLICWSLWFLSFASRSIFAPLLPIIEAEFRTSHAVAGGLFLFLTSGMTISYLLVSNWLNLRVGYKRAILLSLLFMVLFTWLMGYARSYRELAVLCFIVGLGSGVYIPAVYPILTSVFAQHHWGKMISFHETGPAIASPLVPLLTAFALGHIEWRSLFLILSLAFLFATALFWRFSPNPSPEKKTSFPWRSLLSRKVFWVVLAIFTMGTTAVNGVYLITPLFLIHERGFDLETANRILGYTRTVGFIAMLLAGLIIDRLGAKPVMLGTLLVTGLATIALAEVSGVGWIAAMMLLQAMISIVIFPTIIFTIARITTLQERGPFTSIAMGISMLIGFGASPVFMGAVADRWSFETGILLVGVATTLSCLLIRWIPKI